MQSIELPEWMERIRKSYAADPVKWMWIVTSGLVVLIIVGMVGYVVAKQRREAGELLARGLQNLDAGDYAGAVRVFGQFERSFRFSGQRDKALLMNAAARFGLEDYARAEEAYRSYLAGKPAPDFAAQALLGIGACREMLGDTEGALNVYREAGERYGATFLARAIEARTARLMRSTGDFDSAIAIYDRLESDSESLWKDISRGARRLALTGERAAAPEPR